MRQFPLSHTFTAQQLIFSHQIYCMHISQAKNCLNKKPNPHKPYTHIWKMRGEKWNIDRNIFVWKIIYDRMMEKRGEIIETKCLFFIKKILQNEGGGGRTRNQPVDEPYRLSKKLHYTTNIIFFSFFISHLASRMTNT